MVCGPASFFSPSQAVQKQYINNKMLTYSVAPGRPKATIADGSTGVLVRWYSVYGPGLVFVFSQYNGATYSVFYS